MDIDNGRVNRDEPLWRLIQEAGRHAAPADLEAHVLARLATAPKPLAKPSPLISKGAWWGIAACMALLVAGTIGWTAPAFSGSPALFPCFQEGLGLLASPWWFAVLLGMGAMLALDHWAGRALHPAKVI